MRELDLGRAALYIQGDARTVGARAGLINNLGKRYGGRGCQSSGRGFSRGVRRAASADICDLRKLDARRQRLALLDAERTGDAGKQREDLRDVHLVGVEGKGHRVRARDGDEVIESVQRTALYLTTEMHANKKWRRHGMAVA